MVAPHFVRQFGRPTTRSAFCTRNWSVLNSWAIKTKGLPSRFSSIFLKSTEMSSKLTTCSSGVCAVWRSAVRTRGSSSRAQLEGERKVPQIFLIIEWPSKDVAKTFYECDEHRPYRESRIKGATNEFLLVAGEDMTNTARMAD